MRRERCAGCGGTIWVDQVEITTWGDRSPRFMDGFMECTRCDHPVIAHPAGTGPPAPYPSLPTHAEWLKAWGMPVL